MKVVGIYQLPRGTNPGGLKSGKICPTLSTSSWQYNNFLVLEETMEVKYLDLFAGIGGFAYGIERAFQGVDDGDNHFGEYEERETTSEGTHSAECVQHRGNSTDDHVSGGNRKVSCVGFSEIDRSAIDVYTKHFPSHPNLGDIKNVKEKELPEFNLLVGGFPCQAFSIAGKRRGFEDTRGTLFFEIARILKERRPRNFILENVKGLLSHDGGNTYKTIISTLAELGYCVEWQVVNSKNFGVPQNRERVFIIGHFGGIPGHTVFPIRQDDNPLKTQGGRQASDAVVSRTLTATDAKMHLDGTYVSQGILIPEATKLGYAVAEEGDSINLSYPNSQGRRGRVGKGICQTLDTGTMHTVQNYRIRRLTPLECERLQGFPDNWTEYGSSGKRIPDSTRYKLCGNAVTTNVIAHLVKELYGL